MSILFVTGTSTDVGKTIATAALAATVRASGRSVAVCKPAQTGIAPGEPGDLEEISRLTGVENLLELARYPEPLAPDVAARRSSMPLLRLEDVCDAVRALDADVVLVEGAGGLLVRLGTDGFTLVDLARRVGAPVLVVCGAELGTLNHSALTVSALETAGVWCAGLVIGSWPSAPDVAAVSNLEELPSVTSATLLGRLPEGAGKLSAPEFTAAAPSWFDEIEDILFR